MDSPTSRLYFNHANRRSMKQHAPTTWITLEDYYTRPNWEKEWRYQVHTLTIHDLKPFKHIQASIKTNGWIPKKYQYWTSAKCPTPVLHSVLQAIHNNGKIQAHHGIQIGTLPSHIQHMVLFDISSANQCFHIQGYKFFTNLIPHQEENFDHPSRESD